MIDPTALLCDAIRRRGGDPERWLDCYEWAFGTRKLWISMSRLPERWNARHSPMMRRSDSVESSLEMIAERWVESGCP